VSVVSDRIGNNKKGKLMSKEEMIQLIREVASDAMSDNGMIWRRSNAKLDIARAKFPELYKESLESARGMGRL